MIDIEVAAGAGFCSGVQRAVKLAERAARTHGRVVSLGPLIHNQDEVERLRGLGIEPVEGAVPSGQVVIVRSHGVPVEQLEELVARGPVEDATCPHVRACQQRAERMAAQGYVVLVVGDPDHPETDSIVSHAMRGGADRATVLVADGPARLAALHGSGVGRKVAVLAQTTQSLAALAAVVEACLERSNEVRVFNTICDATARRQHEAREMARRADLLLVVGGRHSANTRRLVEICSREQPNTRWIEGAGELRVEWLEGCQRVAVTAGASTPRRAVDKVAARLEELGRSVDHEASERRAGP